MSSSKLQHPKLTRRAAVEAGAVGLLGLGMNHLTALRAEAAQPAPAQFAGVMGERRNPWLLEASPFDGMAYGAFPEFAFGHQDRKHTGRERLCQRLLASYTDLVLEELP